MNIADAAHITVHDYPGGSESLGPRVGISAAVLRNKVNPNNDTHHLTLKEADRLIGITADFRILRALAHAHGFLIVKAPDNKRGESDMSVLEQMVGFMVASGAYGQEIQTALADGAVDRMELERVVRAGQAVMTCVAETNQRLEGMTEK